MDGAEDGIELGIVEGFADGVLVGPLDGAADGKDVDGDELGKAVTSTLRQILFTSQQMLQHLHTTSAGLSPIVSARQSDEISWTREKEEHKAFAIAPDRVFFSSDMDSNAVRKPS